MFLYILLNWHIVNHTKFLYNRIDAQTAILTDMAGLKREWYSYFENAVPDRRELHMTNHNSAQQTLPGAYRAVRKNGQVYYRSSVTYRGKHISLGSFDAQTDAHLAYKQALGLLSGNHVFSPEHYDHTLLLSFDKYVCLLNFRDSGIYIRNPIYLKKTHFEYYYSAKEVYLFDIDDLFYYSEHKIMKRGGHLFVADYGMQVTILSRYGIRSHAVAGRDYLFANGNSHDLRYENIKVINPYHGVTRITNGSGFSYQTRILVNGNYVVGCYPSEVEAAIAYNKAIDILGAAGCPISYQQNYIESVSGREYADIYNRISISPKLLALSF